MDWQDDDYLDTKCDNEKCTGHTELDPETELYVCNKCGLVCRVKQDRPSNLGNFRITHNKRKK